MMSPQVISARAERLFDSELSSEDVLALRANGELIIFRHFWWGMALLYVASGKEARFNFSVNGCPC